MAKTLAQGRKPGSGRKPGKGKTLREGRKPGSGRKRRVEEPVRSESRETMTSRDLEAVDALRELNNSPPQQLPQQTAQQIPQHPQQSSKEASDPAASLATQKQLLSNAAASVTGGFAFQSVGTYVVSPYMHTAAGASPLLVPLASGGSQAESTTESSKAVLDNSRGSSGDDAAVLVHTST